MFDKIVYISDHSANIRLKDAEHLAVNLMNLHLIFEDKDKKVLGEVDDLDKDIVKARFLGEIVNGRLIGGTIRKPSLDASIRVINKSEIPMIVGEDKEGYMRFGVSPFYNDFPVYLDVNNFFSNHFAIFGNSGSGKSCGVSRLFQNMFHDQRLFPYKANILLFDSSGEYYNAFNNLNSINPNYHYRFFSTNEVDGIGEKLRLPIWLLNASDLALLLQATNHSQLPIIERMLKLALIFSQKDMDANNYKNHLIAKAIMTILYTNETSPNKRNEIFSILASCSTPQFNLEAPVQGIGYTRKFRECFLIDSQGQFSESVLLTEYVSSFIKNEYDNYEPKGGVYYGDAVTIKVRLHALIVGENAKFFDVPDYISLESYLSSLLISNGRKYQLVNFNLDDVDDDFAKVITKIYSRLVFEFAKGLKDRASIPFHIIVEEAHRYIQNDTDRFLIGYNIFERIAKEGRKYGVILGLISQRPVELSDTVISQCSNFLIFKMNHPTDVDYIRKMVPNISDEIVEKQKTLQAGTCLGFGMAFKIPLICKLQMPDPAPWSGNCDVVTIWNGNNKGAPRNIRKVAPEPAPTVSQSSLTDGSFNQFDDISPSNDTSISFSFSGNSQGSSSKPAGFDSIGLPKVQDEPVKGFDEVDSNTLNDTSKGFDEIVPQDEPVITENTSSHNEDAPSKPLIEFTDSPVPSLVIPGQSQSSNMEASGDIASLDTDEEPVSIASNESVKIPTLVTNSSNSENTSHSTDSTFGVTSNGSPLVSITPDDMLE